MMMVVACGGGSEFVAERLYGLVMSWQSYPRLFYSQKLAWR